MKSENPRTGSRRARLRKKAEVQHRKLLNLFLLFLIFTFSVILALRLQEKTLPTQSMQKKFVFSSHVGNLLTPKPTTSLMNDLSASPSAAATATPSATPTPGGFCAYVPVFMYHHIEPYGQATTEGHASLTVDDGWFSKQMKYLTDNGYTSISVDQLVKAIQQKQSLPAKSFVVTVDDGYSDMYTYAYPVLKQYHVIGNVMIPTGLINNPGYMTWPELQEMQESGLVNIYNHTWSHSPLGSDSIDKITSEMQTSQSQFLSYLHITPTIMAYPYGSFSNDAINVLRKMNFVAAFSTLPGTNECQGNIMTLPRVRIGNAPMSRYRY